MSNENNGKIKLYERVSNNETTLKFVCEEVRGMKNDIGTIKDNHLPTITKEISKMKTSQVESNTKFDGLNRTVKIVGVIVCLAIAVNIIVNLVIK